MSGRGLKRADIKPCALCGKGVMHTGVPLLYAVSVQRFCIDPRAIERQHGLELLIGNPAIAQIMGTDSDLAKPLSQKIDVLVCTECAEGAFLLARIDEQSLPLDDTKGH